MDDVKQTMIGVAPHGPPDRQRLVAGGARVVRVFRRRLTGGRGCVCIVSGEADFAPILSLLFGTVEVLDGGTDEPATEAECLDVEEDDAEEVVIDRLRRLAEDRVAVATAVIEVEPDWDHPSGSRPMVWVKLEHREDWTLLYTQPYNVRGWRVPSRRGGHVRARGRSVQNVTVERPTRELR